MTGRKQDKAFELEGFIPFRLNQAAERVSLDFAKLYRKAYGMTRPQWRTLANLGQHGRLTARQICDLSIQHKTKVSRAVADLEERKWLKRSTNPQDRREEWLELTSGGRAVFSELSRLGREQDRKLRAALGAQNATALETALTALENLTYGD
ncbi:MAG: MarR family transcriptional regulator [Phyllobacteriaceae bacterium]|nr:MarR family transcriptional regulator [Phyllobacteriaceae bacterium]